MQSLTADLLSVLLMLHLLSQTRTPFLIKRSVFYSEHFSLSLVTLHFWSLPDMLESVSRALRLQPAPANSRAAHWSLLYINFIHIKHFVCQNCTKFNMTLHFLPNTAHAKCGVYRMNCSRDTWRTNIKTESPCSHSLVIWWLHHYSFINKMFFVHGS